MLLTGATGFIGTHVARRLLGPYRPPAPDLPVIALVRAGSREEAVRRLSRAWWEWPDLERAIGGRVEVICGDVSLPRLGLGGAAYDDLMGRVDRIIHAAADLRLNAPLEEVRRVNVSGVANILELARAADRDHGLSRLGHVSTAYVAGLREGEITEGSLTEEGGFASSYERSKYEGERLVRAAGAEIPVSVFRPGMVVGDSRTGAVRAFNTIYYPLRLYLTGRLRVLPVGSGMRVNMVPVDYVADAVARLTFDPRAEGLTFHLTAPHGSLPTVGELVGSVRGWARSRLGFTPPRPVFLPLPASLTYGRYRAEGALRVRDGRAAGALAGLAPYFSGGKRFGRENTDRLIGPYTIDWREALPRMLEYAVYHGFLNRSGRTVHEQALFRLGGRSRPVTFHDMAGGKVTTRTAPEVRADIVTAIRALESMGVRQGERVAVVGYNSTRYLTIEMAIGMAGAVSVPAYYTSPPADVRELLEASGSRLIFVGTPELLRRVREVTGEMPVVSFCAGPLPEGLPPTVISWEEFLARGRGTGGDLRLAHPAAPVSLGDAATIRYSSGTTGRPKGAVFRHEQLVWMAESISSLLPWKARNSPATYFSFLPMNHVVEGILGTYSPYYVPAPVDIYFLQDFRELQRALPEVRPVIFFSVPRFYERLWEGLLASRPGRAYAEARQGGIVRSLLRPLVRRALLRKAGLDRCTWLIAGSAPSSEGLLRDLRGLGIEVHNAYGLTEAPLLTINRLGANRIGTVGTPLPETEVRVAEDGEVEARGPQVMDGYFGLGSGEQPFRDGWLLTGDFGALDGGSLIIQGRKKDLIKTSYGKYVQTAKVEAMLRGIQGVAEAMVVGEGRPYCTALLWIRKGPGAAGGGAGGMDRAVAEVNSRLSRPEQVKAWAVLRNDLSIEGGDLTPNLKLKKEAVSARLSGVIEAMYGDGGAPPEGVLRVGRMDKEGEGEGERKKESKKERKGGEGGKEGAGKGGGG